MIKKIVSLISRTPLFGPLQRVRFLIRPITRRCERGECSHAVVTHDIQDHAFLDVYRLQAAEGPAASLYVHGDEVMRFDCFGPPAGHYHLNLTQARLVYQGENARLYLPGATQQEQVMQAAFELRRNFEYAQRLNRSRKIRDMTFDQAQLDAAANFLEETMLPMCDPE